MEPFKNILVGLDNSPLNETLIQYASFLTDHTSAENIEFVNIVKNINIPAKLKKEFPQLETSAFDERKEMLESFVKRYFNPVKKTKHTITVHKNRGGRLLSFAAESNADLIIAGQKKTLEGTGVTTFQLARKAKCNLLIVPENVNPAANKLLVPIDFSDYSWLALTQAIDFAVRNNSEPEIICQNVYTVPAGYHYTGKSFDDFAYIMEKNAKANYKKFIEKIEPRGIKISPVYSLDTNDNLASNIYDLATKISPDFIIIGAKGRTATSAMLLGSLAEKMVNERMDHPLLVVRYKGKNAGIIETLREL